MHYAMHAPHRAQNLYAKQTVTDRKRLQEFSFFQCHTRLQDPVSSACFDDTEIRKHPNALYIYIRLFVVTSFNIRTVPTEANQQT
jgi:hypothetical protein